MSPNSSASRFSASGRLAEGSVELEGRPSVPSPPRGGGLGWGGVCSLPPCGGGLGRGGTPLAGRDGEETPSPVRPVIAGLPASPRGRGETQSSPLSLWERVGVRASPSSVAPSPSQLAEGDGP